jgi:tellurite resistance protein
MAIRMLERGAAGPLEWLAPVAFVASNVLLVLLIAGTLRALVRGELLPAAAPANAAPVSGNLRPIAAAH